MAGRTGAGRGRAATSTVSSAVHLRFDVNASSLPVHVEAKLLALRDRRVGRGRHDRAQGPVAAASGSRPRDAIERFADIVHGATHTRAHVVRPVRRWAPGDTGWTRTKRSKIKANRGRPGLD